MDNAGVNKPKADNAGVEEKPVKMDFVTKLKLIKNLSPFKNTLLTK